MIIPEELQLRQLILNEFRTGNSKKKAQININANLGRIAVSARTIKFWYKRFQAGNFSFLKRGAVRNVVWKLPNGEEV
jgi:hypothetical protein